MCAWVLAIQELSQIGQRDRKLGMGLAPVLLPAGSVMKINDRLEKLRHQKKLLHEALKQAEAKASTRQRKRDTRAKIILGAVVLSMIEDEREALLAMLLPHTSERDCIFVTGHLKGGHSPELPPDQGVSQLN